MRAQWQEQECVVPALSKRQRRYVGMATREEVSKKKKLYKMYWNWRWYRSLHTHDV